MPQLTIHLPAELAAQAAQAGLDLSSVMQEAVRRRLAERSTDAWLAGLAASTSSEQVPHDRVLAALDAARDEAPTRRM